MRPVLWSAPKTVTLTNRHGYAIRVAVRAGNSAICLATLNSAGNGWSRAVINAGFSRLWF